MSVIRVVLCTGSCIRAGFYTSDPDYDFDELCYQADKRLLNTISHSSFHVLAQLLPPALPQSYDFLKTAAH